MEVDYVFPPGVDPAKQAKVIAVGQTAGTWDARYAHRADALAGHLGQVVATRTLADGRGLATVAFPEANTENDVPTLLTMIFGKYSMAGPAKVAAVRLHPSYGVKPRFGVAGVRERLGVHARPLVMAIFKPALGLSAADHADLLAQVAEAGLDVIKDDEILPDVPGCPTLERVRACRAVLERVKSATGRTVLYAVNLTGRADQLVARARQLVAEGANALLLNVLAYGYGALEALAADAEVGVPIFAHPALAGAWCGAPAHGFNYAVVLGTLMGHAGADAVLYPAHYGSLPFDPVDEAGIRDELRKRGVFPVPSAGIHPGVVPRALADYGVDVILNAGTGIMDHASGPAAGGRAFFEALELHKVGGAFDPDKLPAGALQTALRQFAKK